MNQQEQAQPSIQKPLDRLFIISLTAVVILAIGLVTIVVVSVVPHFGLIGWVASGVVIVCLVCIAIGVVAFTFSRIGLWRNSRNVLHVGDVVVYLDNEGKIHHLSAAHERAKVPHLLLPPPDDDDTVEADSAPMSDEDIADLYQHGQSQESIAKLINTSRHQVREALVRQGLVVDGPKKAKTKSR